MPSGGPADASDPRGLLTVVADTARITAATTFLHGRDRYTEGDVRTVPAELAAYFVAQGWATSDDDLPAHTGPPPADGDVTLGIHNARHDHRSEV